MISKLKQKTRFFLAKRKYFDKKPGLKNFNGLITNSANVLVVMPDNAEDISNAIDIPTYFKKQKKEIILLIETRLQHVPQGERSFESIVFDELSLSKLGLPNAELAGKLSDKRYDLVVDLNRGEDSLSGILANIPKSGLIIGFKKPRADELYNLQIANNQNNAEISYRNFLNSIQMF